MFKIVRTAKQIFSAARNLGQKASVSINSGLKYCTQSKGYVEDASGEFTFEKVVSNQSLTQDKMNSFNTVCPNIAKPQSIDWHAIRKLIYARFADEIAAKPKNAVGTVATYDITDEFKMFKEQGYDFAATREVLKNRNQDTNESPKSIFERMKGLSISCYISNYAGHPQLREDIEKVILQKELVINEFMATATSRIEDPEEYSSELLG